MARSLSQSRPWRVTRLQATLALVLAAVGFLGVTQVRNELLIRSQLRVPSQRLEELGFMLREMERNRGALEQQIFQLRTQLHAYEQGAAQGRDQLEALGQQLERLRGLSGHTHLAGPGVIVELDDSPLPLRPGDDPNTVILHYTDLQGVVNDLYASGAEAVAINGERIISLTGLNCVGTTIIANAKRLAPPYRVTAVGPPDEMAAYVERADGGVQALRAFAFPAKITKAVRVGVPAYRGTFRFTHARPSGPFQ
ncbi:MAG TPA: DUF881 domain-containing protein [bacterium]|nr:DUF881 domain-containing protein [bacterium]